MPFVEINTYSPWVRISKTHGKIVICKELRNQEIWKGQKKARLYYDPENNLFGIEPSPLLGYKLSEMGQIRIRRLPQELPDDGKYSAKYDEEKKMIIVNLNRPIETFK